MLQVYTNNSVVRMLHKINKISVHKASLVSVWLSGCVHIMSYFDDSIDSSSIEA